MITGSIVTYHNSEYDIKKVIDSFLGDNNELLLFVIDNSSNDSLSKLCNDYRIRYIYNNKNLGFGAAHNIAFNQAYELNSEYHFLLNPDIHFNPSIVDDLVRKANSDHQIGLIMPRNPYPDGSIQHLCKLLPTPLDLMVRRFLPNSNFKNKLKEKYELHLLSHTKESEIPCLSGCFMLLRSSTLKLVNGFDDRYFMYLEDVDLCRKMGAISKLIYYPNYSVIHNYEKGSYSNIKLLYFHIRSAIKYFNKWGWIFDQKRKRINNKILRNK